MHTLTQFNPILECTVWIDFNLMLEEPQKFSTLNFKNSLEKNKSKMSKKFHHRDDLNKLKQKDKIEKKDSIKMNQLSWTFRGMRNYLRESSAA